MMSDEPVKAMAIGDDGTSDHEQQTLPGACERQTQWPQQRRDRRRHAVHSEYRNYMSKDVINFEELVSADELGLRASNVRAGPRRWSSEDALLAA